MKVLIRNPYVEAAVVGVLAAILFLLFKVATDDLGTSTYVTTGGVAIGAAIGSLIGRRRRDRKAAAGGR